MARHAPHALMFVLPLLVFGGLFWREWSRVRRPRPAQPARLLRTVNAVLLLAAAAVHTSVIGHHVAESALLGAGFGVLAALQVGAALTTSLAPVRRPLRAALALQLGVLGLWVWTRVVGLPFGIAEGHREQIAGPGLLASGLEVGSVLVLLVLLGLLSRTGPTGDVSPGAAGPSTQREPCSGPTGRVPAPRVPGASSSARSDDGQGERGPVREPVVPGGTRAVATQGRAGR